MSDEEAVELEVASVQEGCLVFEYESVQVEGLEERITELRSDPLVVAVSPVLIEAAPDGIVEERPWAHDRLDVPDPASWTWPAGRGAVVAIVDTGIDADHPDLDGRVARMTFPGDPGGDFDQDSHGTHVAGIVGAVGGNETGIVGIAPDVRILDVPVVTNPHDEAPTVADGIRWAVDNGADVVNMSFGVRPIPRRSLWDRLLGVGLAGSASESLEVALMYAEEAGVILVASGGNCGDPEALSRGCDGETNVTTMPAAAPEVWAVGATTATDDRASFSTEREYIDLSAPGERILSLIAGGETDSLSGTSQAAPHVTGAIALFLGSDGPFADMDDASRSYNGMSVIMRTLVDLGRPGHDESFGEGRLDIAAALTESGWVASNPFEGDWIAHSRSLRITPDGDASFTYRLYPGYDHAEIEMELTSVGTTEAHAVVTSSNRRRDFSTSDGVSFTLDPATDTIELVNQATGYFDMLCGPRAEPGFCGA